jgi:hypothetical protein
MFMFTLFLILIMVLCAVFGPKLLSSFMYIKEDEEGHPNPSWKRISLIVRGTFLFIAFLLMLSTSFVTIDANQVGHMKRIYFGKTLPPGRIIALPGEQGPQAEILGPGLNFRPFIDVLYDVEEMDVVDVPDGKYAVLMAKDGAPLRENQYLADPWENDKMKDAVYFMGGAVKGEEAIDHPRGQKGPQYTVLRPGKHRINRYMFDVKLGKALNVEAGEVAVIKSNVQTCKTCTPIEIEDKSGVLSVPLVPRGCIGVWNEAIKPGTYYLNSMAYEWTKVPTRVQTWAYKGGFTKRRIDLDVDQEGKITQEVFSEDIPIPEDAADGAVTCRVEGWTVPQELRVLFQIEPEDAPFVVASVGGALDAENKIVTPAVRSEVRNVIGRSVVGTDEEKERLSKLSSEERALVLGTRVLDLVEKRSQLETQIERAVQPEAMKARITIKDIRLADPGIPPELLVAKLRAQLADQLIAAYKKEEKAHEQRKEVKRAEAQADKQDQLVQADYDVRISIKKKAEMQNLGEGQKLRDIEIAAGQKAKVAVLGEERVLQLEMFQKALDAAVSNPEIVKIPSTLVTGGGDTGLVGAAAVLGQSNLSRSFAGPAVKK